MYASSYECFLYTYVGLINSGAFLSFDIKCLLSVMVNLMKLSPTSRLSVTRHGSVRLNLLVIADLATVPAFVQGPAR